jgi:histidine triad (HIT) family protein
MRDCIFCRIINGELESNIVYKDNICTVFMDIQPVNPGHVLIVPNKHVDLICDLEDEIVKHMFVIAKKVNKSLRNSSVRCEGVNYFLADGEAAFQEVFHTHLHCFPRFRNDGFDLRFSDEYFKKPSREDLHDIAVEIKHNMDNIE